MKAVLLYYILSQPDKPHEPLTESGAVMILWVCGFIAIVLVLSVTLAVRSDMKK